MPRKRARSASSSSAGTAAGSAAAAAPLPVLCAPLSSKCLGSSYFNYICPENWP